MHKALLKTNLMNTTQEKYQRAAARVSEIRAYYRKLTKFAIFTLLFLGFNYFIAEIRSSWVYLIFGFWMLGLVIKGIKLFVPNIIFGQAWEKRMIEAEMQKQQNREFYS